MGGSSSTWREPFPNNERTMPSKGNQSRTPPEDQNPKGCSLHSMEPLRDWFCRGADMTSAAEYEAALCQLEEDPPDMRQYSVNIRKGRWTNFLLEGVKFPAMTVDVIQRGEALAIFEKRPYHTLSTDIKSRSSVYSSIIRRRQTSSCDLPKSGRDHQEVSLVGSDH